MVRNIVVELMNDDITISEAYDLVCAACEKRNDDYECYDEQKRQIVELIAQLWKSGTLPDYKSF